MNNFISLLLGSNRSHTQINYCRIRKTFNTKKVFRGTQHHDLSMLEFESQKNWITLMLPQLLGLFLFLCWGLMAFCNGKLLTDTRNKKNKNIFLALVDVKVQEADYAQISLFQCLVGVRICVTGFISLRGNNGLSFTSLGIIKLNVSIAGKAAEKIATSTEMQSSPSTFNHA